VNRIYQRLNQRTAIQFVDYVLEKLPFEVESIQTDNGSEFQSSFHWHVLDREIRHVHIKHLTPRLNGKVERSHRIDAEEFYQGLEGQVIDSSELFNEKLQEWQTSTTTLALTARRGPHSLRATTPEDDPG
jgi:hypothetical protein